MMVRQTSLSANMVQFCRFLRLRNFRLGVGEEITLLHALQYVDFTDRHIFRATLKCLLCKSHDELLKFDDLFDEYNTQVRDGQDAKVVSKITSSIDSGGTKDALKSLKYWLHGNSNKEIEETASYSAGETLSQQDFALIPADRTHELRVTIMALARSL
ncbi:MAG: VWA containing CoxE family protein, partial [Chitinophagaceae bacterium]